MTQEMFEIGADGVNAGRIVEEIRATVARKSSEGLYSDPRVGRAELTNLRNLKNDEEFLEFYLQCLRDAVFVDISDFEIHERRRLFAGALVLLKKTIWNLLRFYTYRLWSQQNEVNALLLSATEAIDGKYRDRIRELEARVAELEKKV